MPLTALLICKERPVQQSAVTAREALYQLSGFKSPTLGSDRLLGLFPQQNSYLLQTGRGAGQIAKQKDSNAVSEAASADPGQCLLGSAASAQAHKRSSSLPARAVHDAHGDTSREQSFLPLRKCLAPPPLVSAHMQLMRQEWDQSGIRCKIHAQGFRGAGS